MKIFLSTTITPKFRRQLLIPTLAPISSTIVNDYGSFYNQRNHLHYKKNFISFRKYNNNSKKISVGLIGALTGFGIIYYYLDNKKKVIINASIKNNNELTNDDDFRSDLPLYKMGEVAEHDSLEKGIWITYRKGVYDITKFIPEHPGGNKILIGAGGAIDPFWNIYQQHNSKQVLELLEKYRIGNLPPEDYIDEDGFESLWAAEPKRHQNLKPTSKRPFNAEPPLSELIKNFITPTEYFYVRNHLPVPIIDEDSYKLKIEIENSNKQKFLKLKDIKKLPRHTIMATIMCGGNRRSEMNKVKEVKGLSWNAAAVGNSKWTGAKLKDILEEMGVKSNECQHVIFEGLDLDPTANPYAASIPLSKAMDERGDVILAYEMNEKPLTRDHGYPLRVIVPGVIGARNVKWVGRIIVSDNESESHWQQKDYKGFSPSTDWETVDFSKSPAIQNMPVTSAICLPESGSTIYVKDDFIIVKGYAWSGGGNKIIRVDLTIDCGKNWYTADLEQENDVPGRHWAWSLWSAKIPINKNFLKQKSINEIEIWSKAIDSNYNCQPENFENIWNLRGVLSNAYHKVKVNLKLEN